ncbi:cleavage and polyadenylation specificity factor subunit 3-II isoform X2 [Benincasa hispida]|uniref:cleavage and polyadenylation specificity factor subunit 3-II isoform X2 n=1 Tax=Benincasa hispida TaxID=102211 RepID=UPI001900A7D6|nr:cleavage and polyadenylation specificity factor subunit 3-II isoform X2 [Benincasa hispida]
MAIDCLVLGAGQEVGKSCVVVTINGKRIMFDCGMHLGYVDHHQYPDFSRIPASCDYNTALSCIIITHFHLDHIGALPYFTEVCGYNGPIYMTYPTMALAPLMLEDYRKVLVDRRGEAEQFTNDHIMECMKKVVPVDLKQTIQVLGAAMFYAKVGDAAMVYTGDYNMTPDRHLGAAQIDRMQLDLLITESTYATTIRDSKYGREREFLKAVHNCVASGGKVLIPTFALGRAQELCVLLDDYWERMNLKVPIYVSAGLTVQANMYYKMLISWTSQKVKETYSTRNAFDFKNVQKFDRSMIDAPGPCILFATPGMISGGFSLEVFKRWAPSKSNLITLPGYCVAGTVGHKLMSGKPTKIDLDKDTQIDVQCQIHQLAFSPHTDSKGIMDLVKFLSPKHVILVHGEKPKMATLKQRIHSELGIPCYDPANNETVSISSTLSVKAEASRMFIQSCSTPNFKFLKRNLNNKVDPNLKDLSCKAGGTSRVFIRKCSNHHFKYLNRNLDTKFDSSFSCGPELQVSDDRVNEGILVMEKGKKTKVLHQDEVLLLLGEQEHEVRFANCRPIYFGNLEETHVMDCLSRKSLWLSQLFSKLSSELSDKNVQNLGEYLQVESFTLSICSKEDCPYRTTNRIENESTIVFCCCSWLIADEILAWKIISILEKHNLGST